MSAIGVGHAIEQEIRAVKVLEDIKGIVNNRKALDISLLYQKWEISFKISVLYLTYNIQNEAAKRNQHYQLTGSKN